MSASDVHEDRLDVALAMIDTRAWGARLRVVTIVRVLERRSPDGWAYISADNLADRAGISGRYGWDLFGSPPSSAGLMWRVERVLQRGPVGRGTRPTAWKVNPAIEEWRGVPWIERDRRRRLLELAVVDRAPDRGTEPGLVQRSYTAAQAELVPRSHVAALDPLVPRSMSRRYGSSSAAMHDRGTSEQNPAPLSVSWSDADASSLCREQSEFAHTLAEAIATKTGRTCNGKLRSELERFHGQLELEVLVRAVMRAPDDYKPPLIVRDWIPAVVRAGGQLPGAKPAATPAREFKPPACEECKDAGFVLDDDGDAHVCPSCRSGALSPSHGTMVTS